MMAHPGPDLSVAVPTLEPDDQLVARLAAAAVRSAHAQEAGSPVTGPLAWRVAAAAASVAVVTTGGAYAAGVIGRERAPDVPTPAVTHPTEPSQDAGSEGLATISSAPAPQTSSQPVVADPSAGSTTGQAGQPTGYPTGVSGGGPSGQPTGRPVGPPSGLPTPSAHPTGEPIGPPTAHPTGPPSGLPTPSARPGGPTSGRPAPGDGDL